jgi:Na+-driven multidrug efflux pump
MVSGIALGNMYFYTLGLTVIYGFNSVIETLASQTVGQRDLYLCGVYLNRGRIVTFTVCCGSTVFMCLAKPIFLAMGIEAPAVEYA